MAKEVDFTFQLLMIAALGAFIYYIFMQKGGRYLNHFSNYGSLTMPDSPEVVAQKAELLDKVYNPIMGHETVDEADLWAQANPTGKGALKFKNFLDSGFMASQIDTVGQNRKTKNNGLRPEPIVPQYRRAVWRPDMFKPDDIETRVLNGNTC